MAHRSAVYGIFLGMVGFALATGCVVSSDDGDDGDDATAGEGGESSGGSSSGGSSTGGRGGTSTGGTSTGGTSTGGTSTGGTSTGGSSTGGSAGNTDAECDPDMGELDNTYYPDCTATPGNSCEECIQENCCELSRICYGYDPGNVCGWGGPDGDGEITCYIACAQDYVTENGVFDEDGIDECTTMCTTEMCGQIGNATQDLAVCLQENCEEACWPAE